MVDRALMEDPFNPGPGSCMRCSCMEALSVFSRQMHQRRGAITCLFQLVLALAVAGQPALEARVVDAVTSDPLPYVSVATSTGKGVIANEEGVFRTNVKDGDSLSISCLGYHSQRLSVVEVRRTGEVRLEAAVAALPAVQVVGAADSLYDLVLACGNQLRRAKRYHGRVLYELDTRTGTGPVEAIECFYNGGFKGGNIEALDLKQGRIALLPDRGRYVANLNTSRGFMLLHPAEENGDFPATPLQYRSRKALRKAYRLSALPVEGTDQYRIRFTPKDASGAFFQGELWAEAATATVQGLLLECDRCQRHPFRPLGPGDALKDLSLRYRQEYAPWQGRMILKTIALEYALTYASGQQASFEAALEKDFPRERRLWSKGVLHLFAPGERFVLPLFHYEQDQTDYRKVLSMPYDSAFWAHAPTLVPTAQQRRDQALFTKEGILLHGTRLGLPDGHAQRFFESNYAFWSSGTRVRLKQMTDSAQGGKRGSDQATAVADQIRLRVQLYLNIDSVPGGYGTFSTTVLDGFNSYCHLDEQHHPALVLNLYFDLCEMERRKMVAALEGKCSSVAQIKAVHAEALRDMDQVTGNFLRETHYGSDREALARWNQRVREAMGVDNFALFGLDRNAE
jgi:hypothetical protein